MVEIDRDLKKLQRIDSGFDSGKEEYSDFIAKKFSGFDVQVLSAPSKPVKPIAPKKLGAINRWNFRTAHWIRSSSPKVC